jgi:hypothetical protein
MPFNAGGQTYQGGALLAQGLGNFGQGIGAGILGQIEEQRKKDQFADQIMLQALENGYATPDDWLKYSQSNHKAKQDYAMRIASNFHDDAQKKRELQNAQTQAAIDASKAQTAYHLGAATAQQAAAPFAMTGIWTTDADGNPVQVGTYGPTGDPHMFPGQVIKSEKDTQGVDSSKATQVTDVATGEKLPFYSIPLGPKQSQILGAPETGLRQDPATGLWQEFKNKAWVTLPPAQQQQLRFFGPGGLANPQVTPSPTPGAGGAMGGALSEAWKAIGSIGGGDAAPAPTPAATPLDAIMQQIPGGGAPQTPQTGNPLDAILQQLGGATTTSMTPTGAGTPSSRPTGKKLDKATAAQFLQQAGGDPKAARQLAIAAGYTF